MARRRRRDGPAFSLSFLDIMSCGFGAVVLVFLIIRHSMSENEEAVNVLLHAEVDRVEEEVLDGERNLVEIRRQLADATRRIADARNQSAELDARSEAAERELIDLEATTVAREEHINALRSEIESLESRADELDGRRFGSDAVGTATISVAGTGTRQYLTGLQVGGSRILVLLDTSSSMLDDTIVNIIRRRNMSADRQRAAPKWQQAVGSARWLLAQMPFDSEFQLYTFAEEWRPALDGTQGTWLEVDGEQVSQAMEAVEGRLPAGGTALASVFRAVGQLSPLPDNVYLITDGLPTLGDRAPRRNTVTGRQRLALFEDARDELPTSVTMNVILLPLEGDPMASASYWMLASESGGAYISPSEDWP